MTSLSKRSHPLRQNLVVCALPEYKVLTLVCGEDSHQKHQANRHLKADTGLRWAGKIYFPSRTKTLSKRSHPLRQNLVVCALPECKVLTLVCGENSHQKHQANRHLIANTGLRWAGKTNSHQDCVRKPFTQGELGWDVPISLILLSYLLPFCALCIFLCVVQTLCSRCVSDCEWRFV